MERVEAVMSRPFEWGGCDCVSAACDVFRDLHGVDPLAPWRGRYRTKAQAWRLVTALGGPVAAAGDLARRAGLSEGAAVGALGVAGKSFVICVAPGWWAGKSKSGFALVRSVEGAWHLA